MCPRRMPRCIRTSVTRSVDAARSTAGPAGTAAAGLTSDAAPRTANTAAASMDLRMDELPLRPPFRGGMVLPRRQDGGEIGRESSTVPCISSLPRAGSSGKARAARGQKRSPPRMGPGGRKMNEWRRKTWAQSPTASLVCHIPSRLHSHRTDADGPGRRPKQGQEQGARSRFLRCEGELPS